MIKPANALRRLNTPDTSRIDIFMAELEQNHREWRSPWPDVTGAVDAQGRKVGWQTVDRGSGQPCQVDTVLAQQYRVVVSVPAPRWRQLLRWLINLI